MKTIIAIDPGPGESAFVIYDGERIIDHGLYQNKDLLELIMLDDSIEGCVIEMVASYGMPVGKSVFETCVWIGKFADRFEVTKDLQCCPDVETIFVYRNEIKVHHCKSSRATKANVNQAMQDKYALGESNHGKGNKANPGFFYGFHSDVWDAFAIASYYFETLT